MEPSAAHGSVAPPPDSTFKVIVLSPIEKVWLLPLKGREEVCGKVAQYLIGLGVCARCVFRLLKIKDIKFYREELPVCLSLLSTTHLSSQN